MKRVIFLHPSIHNLNEMVKYLCISDLPITKELVWDDKNPEIVIASEHIYKNYKMMKQLKMLSKKNVLLVYHAGEASFPDLTIFDYAISINTRLTNLDRIVRIPPSVFYARSTIETIKENDLDSLRANEVFKQKKDFCNFIYSNPVAHPMRDELFYRLSEYKKVDSLGSHLNNANNTITRREKNWAVLSVMMKEPYKFTIASENALFDGYTSEKLLTTFQAHSIPIYWGNPYVAEEFNEDAFINCHAFETIEQIVERVKEIDNDDDLWKKMIAAPWQTEKQKKNVEIQMKEYSDFITRLFTSDYDLLKRRPEGTFAGIYSSWFFRRYRVKNSFFQSLKNYLKRKLTKNKR